MGKYYKIYKETDIDEYLIGETDDWYAALKMARNVWDAMPEHEKKDGDVRVLHFLYDHDDGDVVRFMYNVYDEWFQAYRVYMNYEEDMPVLETFDWCEAYELIHDNPEGHVDIVDYRTRDIIEENIRPIDVF